jgi:heme-degrading monooxygenase HmoA
MYARSTTIMANPQMLDAGMAHMRDETMPALKTMPGFIGMSMLADRESGRVIVTTSWDSEEAMNASDEATSQLRRDAAEAMGGRDPQVDRWEIALMHRAHPGHDGSVARVLWGETDPARADDNLSTMRTAVLPRMEELPGFCSMSLFVDRATGRSAMTTTYDSRELMAQATDQAMQLRRETAEHTGTRITDVAEFEVVMHELRVPETA